MAVASRGAALSAFRELIHDDPVEARAILRRPYLPEGLDLSRDPVGMDPATLIGGYGKEARYTLGAADPETMRAIAGPPADVLSGRPSITSDTVAAYAKASLDLTMEGGTTSGVVYPLAVCELATDFRFRNVGGASAGAIAAALTAAAELGRSSAVLASGGLRPPRCKRQDPLCATNGVQIRRGFTGIADIISWLAQTRPGDQEADEYRLAQLFRPGSCYRRHLPGRSRGHARPDLATAAACALRLWMDPAAVHARPDLRCGGAHRLPGMAVHRSASHDSGDHRSGLARCAGVHRHSRRSGTDPAGSPIWTPQAADAKRARRHADWSSCASTPVRTPPRARRQSGSSSSVLS